MSDEEADKMYVYLLPSMLCGLIVPAEVEEAIRRGEMEAVSLSKGCDKAMFKVKGKPTLFVPLKEVDMNCGENGENGKAALERLYDGKGQSKETLNKQKQILDQRKKKTVAASKRMIFEDLEKRADEAMQKELNERSPKGHHKGHKSASKLAQKWRERTKKFRSAFNSEENMIKGFGANWKNGLKINLHNMNWDKINGVKAANVNTKMPKRAKMTPINEDSLLWETDKDGGKR